ncbi:MULTISPECIES: HNH endonuclease [Arcicella]|uniref:HNH endonuclease n=1 Tax=Arcicella aquatica TaxID=217141 RepID=A0ABU5QT07_9BACT|nr:MULTISPECIES: HNH endonuclease [Arcicella]MDR6563713.1 5-methylcytosine-specific restriction endonuclease McrA [Arcicella sp. BE51]MDR6814765.1 5-methylcytosine-specific restriction endonuclease McrA [Arcicella sp. BE140]MDR6826231.1 5-methylcytosine-specific restriction endonuclease McrA [Arcicella sp. BE139]MEA5260148.1 HNH endonuclease [Arcicella aquatica]
MGRKVLVLNQDYSALTVCSIPKAFLLVFLKKADLISESATEQLRSVSQSFPMPSVIRLHRYVYLPYKGVMLSRQNIFRRDGGQCQYCGTPEDLTLDHVLPKSRGGRTSWDNLATACKRCNSRKGDLTPEEAGMPLKTKPYKPSFVMFLRDFGGSIEESWLPFLGKRKEKAFVQ